MADDLPDPQLSRAVLVGVADYVNLSALDAVRNNLADLADALSADTVWGLPPENCLVVPDPASATQLLDPLSNAARIATDTLLFYYAGHGLPHPTNSSLYLALPGSDRERMYTSVQYEQVREVLRTSKARRRIVILDCCYSGRALESMGDASTALANEAAAEGTFVLAAAAENAIALSPAGWRNTAFTTELLHIIHNGVEDAGPLLNLDCIYDYLNESLTAKSLPHPHKNGRDNVGRLTLIRNQAYQPPAARHLVIVDCDYLANALRARFAASPDPDDQLRGALHGMFTELIGRGEVQAFASKSGLPTGSALRSAAEHTGVTLTLVGSDDDLHGRASVDVEMTAAAVAELPAISQLTLVSGDRGFVAVIEKAHQLGVTATVAGLADTVNPALATVADHVIWLEVAEPADTDPPGPGPAAPDTSAAGLADEPATPASDKSPESPEVSVTAVGADDMDVTDQDLADELSALESAADVAYVLDNLPIEQLIRILGLMNVEKAGPALAELKFENLTAVLEGAPLDLLARLTDEVYRDGQIRLIELMGVERAAFVLPQIGFAFAVVARMDPGVALEILRHLQPSERDNVLRGTPDPLDNLLDHMNPDEVADYLRRISPSRALKLLSDRDQDRADRFFDQMEPGSAGRVLAQMEADAAVGWLARADPDRAAVVVDAAENRYAVPLLKRLDPDRVELLLSRMRPVRAQLVRIAMQRPDEKPPGVAASSAH